MKEYFFKDIFYLSIVRVFAFANVPLQTFIFATFLTAELIQYFFILAGLFSILVVFEGGAGTVLTYEYNRRLGNQKELTFLVEYFRRRFFKLTIYYIISAIAAFLLYNSMFSGMLNEYTYQYIFCVLMMGLSFNLYPIICISEGYGYVRQALLVKSIAPILSMLVYLIYVVTLKDIKAIYIIPTVTFFCYSIYILFNCKFLAVDYFALRKTNNEHAISHNVSKANVSWTAGYVLTQGFPLLLPFVLSATEAAQLLLTSNLLNAFLSFTCIGATVIGPRIPHMIEKNDLSYKNFVIKNLIFIYSVLILCLIFFDDLLDIFYLIFDNEKFLNKIQLFNYRLIELINPRYLIIMSNYCIKMLLATDLSSMSLRGKWFDFNTPNDTNPKKTRVLYEPTLLINNPDLKKDAWEDLKEIKSKLGG